MRRYSSLRRRADFARLTRRGRRHGSAHLAVFVLPGAGGASRLGISIGKAVGNAVVRNAVRRRIKGILDAGNFGQVPLDVVVVARPGSGALSFAVLQAELGGALGWPG